MKREILAVEDEPVINGVCQRVLTTGDVMGGDTQSFLE